MRGAILGHQPQSVTRTRQYVGKSNWGNDLELLGMIDDVRVYDRSLTLDEVGQIYQGDLVESLVFGGEDPQVTIFWGDEDAGETTNLDASSSGWYNSIDLGTLSPG